MFMNLHTLPPGVHLYTAFVGDMESHEEVDLEARSNLTPAELVPVIEAELSSQGYDPAELLAFADQCTSEGILWYAPGVNGEDLAS